MIFELRKTKERGTYQIWFQGEHWATARASWHGIHGMAHTLEYPDGCEITKPTISKHRLKLRVASYKRRSKTADYGSAVPDQPKAIHEVFTEAVNADWIKSPAVRKKERDEKTRRWNDIKRGEEARRAQMVEAYFSIRDRHGMTPLQREALAYVYKEAFSVPLPFPEGRPHD